MFHSTSAFPFRSCKREGLTRATLNQLSRWVETYVQVLFPENGIEYWSDGELFKPNNKLLADVYSSLGPRPAVAVFVDDSRGEGLRIHVALTSDDRIERLLMAKTFDSHERAWAIAKAIHHALSFVLNQEMEPRLVEMVEAVPHHHGRVVLARTAKVNGSIILVDHGTRAVVTTADGVEIASYTNCNNATWALEFDALVHDWKVVAKAFEVKFDSTSQPILSPERIAA